jgi:hypothetical protein
MDAEKILLAVIGALPTAVGVALFLGLGKVAADLLRHLAARVRKHVKATKSPLDDMLASPLIAAANALAKDLEDGKIDGKPAADKAKELAEALAKELAKKK